MTDQVNKADQIIIRAHDDAWKVVGVQIVKGHEITYEDHLSQQDAEKLARSLSEQYNIPWVKEDSSLDTDI